VGHLDAYAAMRYRRYLDDAARVGQPLRVDAVASEANAMEPLYHVALRLPPLGSGDPPNPKLVTHPGQPLPGEAT
jgi:hypothetical protein